MYYSAEHLVAKAKQVEDYKSIPEEYWICCIRVNEADQKPNEFNDTLHLMKGEQLVMTTTCTTTPGLPALRGGFKKYNKAGAAVVKSDIWMNEAFAPGLHNSRMKALRQVKDIFAHRDNDMDDIAEELGVAKKGMWHTNIHAATYDFLSKLRKLFIKGWSYGCIVCNYMPEYKKMIELTEKQKTISVVVLNEFSV